MMYQIRIEGHLGRQWTGWFGGLTITLECSPSQMDAQAAIQFITDFAGRVEQPLRHLL